VVKHVVQLPQKQKRSRNGMKGGRQKDTAFIYFFAGVDAVADADAHIVSNNNRTKNNKN
jgi:hypothetical protein